MGTRLLKLYTPHRVQLAMHQSKARYRVFAAGRQVGKSTFSNMEMLKKAWENPQTKYAFVSPIFSQAKEQYRRLVNVLNKEAIQKRSDSELRVELINGSVMEYLSGDNPHSLRGKTLHGVIVDEYRDQQPNLWQEILRPMISTTQGWALFSSTPNGFDAFYDLAEKARTDPDWQLFTGASTCNPLFTQEEFDAAKKEMSEAFFAQEILAEFRDLHSGSAYVNFTEDNLSEAHPFAPPGQIIQPYQSILVALDFNLSPMAWTLGQQAGEKTHWFDEIFLKKSHTQEAALELIARVKQLPMKADPQLILIGDATGKAGQRAAAGKSDYAILEELLTQAGISFENRTPESNPLVRDRINVVNSRLKAADGTRYLTVNPKTCPNLKRDFQRVAWKQGSSFTLDQSSNPDLTHASDGVGYVLCHLHKMWQPSPGRLHTIRRV